MALRISRKEVGGLLDGVVGVGEVPLANGCLLATGTEEAWPSLRSLSDSTSGYEYLESCFQGDLIILDAVGFTSEEARDGPRVGSSFGSRGVSGVDGLLPVGFSPEWSSSRSRDRLDRLDAPPLSSGVWDFCLLGGGSATAGLERVLECKYWIGL